MKPQNCHFKTFLSTAGYYILVGNSAQDNDQLSIHVGRPDDLWLHVNGCPGSHVIVRQKPNEREFPRTTIDEAAALAAYFSKARKASTAPVHITLCKHVTKERGAPAGQVMIRNYKAVKAKPELVGERLPEAPDEVFE